jgi:hypothetical protein
VIVRSAVLVLATAAVLLAGCGSLPSSPAGLVVDGEPVATPYAGPMDLPVSHRDRASVRERSGAAGRALECDRAPYDGGGADYDSGLASVQDSAAEALENLLREDGRQVPGEGYRVEREDGGRVLLSYDVAGRTKVAFVAVDGVRDFNGDEGWGIEAWAQCDPAELPSAVTEALGIGVWQDRSGTRVPVARIRSFPGPAHCDWQDLTFLLLGAEATADQYIRDPAGKLTDLLRFAYDAHADLPAGATDTGLHRDGRELWLAPDRAAAYLVSVDDPADVELWPGVRDPVGCA